QFPKLRFTDRRPVKPAWISTLFLTLLVASPFQASLALQRGGIHMPYTWRIKDKPRLKRLSETERQKRRAEGRRRALERQEQEERERLKAEGQGRESQPRQ